jgi:mannosyltransferase
MDLLCIVSFFVSFSGSVSFFCPELLSMKLLILIALVAIFLAEIAVYIRNYQPTISSDLIRTIYEESKHIVDERFNETKFYLNRAKLKGASNSYVEPIYLNDKSHLVINENTIQLENATLLVLCRNWELQEILSSMRSLEDKFNKDYHYTWTFLNDVPFDEDFKYWTTEMASGETEYGLIPSIDWNKPSFINEEKYEKSIEIAIEKEILYGFSKSYRNMCHFNSGFFFRQELVNKYDYYFRIEPGVQYFCDFQMDPFRFMRENGKKYSFVVSLYEYPETIPTLWETVEDFLNEYPNHLHPNNSIGFITDKDPIGNVVLNLGNSSYNLCHFWSNFEIGDLNFFRSQSYLDYFNYLSSKGGFYYERWGDAPVHSIGAALLLDKEEIFHFEDIGYNHVPFFTYPTGRQIKKYKRCVYPSDKDNINVRPGSCLPRWWKHGTGKRFLKEYYHEDEYMRFKEAYNKN